MAEMTKVISFSILGALEKARKIAFWTADKLTGKKVTSHYNDIFNYFQNPLSESPKLKNLLSHATHTTAFFRHLEGKSNLADFPIINKTIIRESFNAFISNAFSPSQIIPVVTSGSTGTPFRTYQDNGKKKRNQADTIFFASKAGYQIGHRLIYLKIWALEKMSHPMKYFIQNQVPVDVLHLNDYRIELLIKSMESSRSTFGILGYASALELICKYLERNEFGKIKANVKSIISMSESLSDYTSQTIKKYFDVPVVARYSNLENGIIAQQELNDSGRYLVNTASYLLEILKIDSDEPANAGELGRIVVTDLHNYAMPMIRYDTGDIGSFETDSTRPGLLFLSRIEGRKMDLLFDTKGDLVSSYIAYKNMWKYTEIIQYQLIQTGKKQYIFRINIDGLFTREKQLIEEFKTYLGMDADFKIEYVTEIPLLASGKRRKVVNDYRKV